MSAVVMVAGDSSRMNDPNSMLMDSSKPVSCFPRSTSKVSLHERFSQVLMDQLTHSRIVTFDPVRLQQRNALLLMKRRTPSPSNLQTRRPLVRMKRCVGRSVWTRLGWRRPSASSTRGFWGFRNKYRWRARCTCSYRRRGNLHSRHLTGRNVHKVTAGRTQLSWHLHRGGVTGSAGRGLSKARVPTKKQLDAQLEEYMSMSKSRLDKELDDYMSRSRRRLDTQLDEYMNMAGQLDLLWA